MKLGKIVICFFWLAVFVNIESPLAQPLSSVLFWLGLGVFLVHYFEQWFFNRRLSALGQPLSVKDRLLIMVFGGFHLMTLMRQVSGMPVSNEQNHSA